MKRPSLSVTKRLILTVGVVVMVSSFGFGIVIHSLYSVERMLRAESSEHIAQLTLNSVVTRQVFELTTRVQLLEQAILYRESALSVERFNIDQQLQQMRELSADPVFTEKMDNFIENFHRFLGNSLALNRILKETKETDIRLERALDKLEYLVADSQLHRQAEQQTRQDNINLSIMTMLRESFLTVGKQVGTVRSRITPETEKVVIIDVQKELDIFLLHLTNLDTQTPQLMQQKQHVRQQARKLHAALRKMQANLDQRWTVMAALVTSQNALLKLVQDRENAVQNSAIQLTKNLEQDISQSRMKAAVIASLAVCLGLLLVSIFVRRHIQRPMDSLSDGFHRLEASSFHRRIALGRTDEWSRIEAAFNQMAARLEETYSQLMDEKKNFDFLAHHDPLTGLANRLLAMKHLQSLIDDIDRHRQPFVLLYLDVDQFKIINDSLGHATGDQLLIDVAEGLKTIIGQQGLVARMGGDEFMIILSEVANIATGEGIAAELNQALRRPYFLDDQTVFVSTSIGLCQFPHHGTDGETLIRNADTAMYQAKRRGRDQYCVYTDSMTLEANDLIEMLTGLRQAIERNQFEMVFRPVVELRDNRIVAAEVSIRWHHPVYGVLEPSDFLDVAATSEWIVEMDDWLLRQIFAAIRRWKQSLPVMEELAFFVRFSARTFFADTLEPKLESLVAASGGSPEQLVLEMSKQDMMSDYERSVAIVSALQSRGFRIGIDEFGTGHSSLTLLKQLPIDIMKLGQNFIEDMARSERDSAIVKAILHLARELDLTVVAEGVKTSDQIEQLMNMGCRYAQGDHFSLPLSATEWERLVTRRQA